MKSEIVFIQPLNLEVEFIVGRCQEENHKAIDLGEEDDIWFHANDMSSCHIICLISKCKSQNNLELNKKDLKYIIKQGAILCKKYTNKAKNEKNFEVVYTEIKYLEKTKIPGQVIPNKMKYIKI